MNATIGHPVAAVFAHLADPLRWHEFAPAVAYRQPIGDGPVRVGSRWMSTDRIGPFRIHFVDELAALEPNRRVVWLSSAPWNARVEYHCSPDGDGTRIRATYEGTLSGTLRWQVGWLPSWATRLILAQDFRRLNRLLTLQSEGGSPLARAAPRADAPGHGHGSGTGRALEHKRSVRPRMYELLLFVHVVCAVIWVGGALYAQILAVRAARSDDPGELPPARHATSSSSDLGCSCPPRSCCSWPARR